MWRAPDRAPNRPRRTRRPAAVGSSAASRTAAPPCPGPHGRGLWSRRRAAPCPGPGRPAGTARSSARSSPARSGCGSGSSWSAPAAPQPGRSRATSGRSADRRPPAPARAPGAGPSKTSTGRSLKQTIGSIEGRPCGASVPRTGSRTQLRSSPASGCREQCSRGTTASGETRTARSRQRRFRGLSSSRAPRARRPVNLTAIGDGTGSAWADFGFFTRLVPISDAAAVG